MKGVCMLGWWALLVSGGSVNPPLAGAAVVLVGVVDAGWEGECTAGRGRW